MEHTDAIKMQNVSKNSRNISVNARKDSLEMESNVRVSYLDETCFSCYQCFHTVNDKGS